MLTSSTRLRIPNLVFVRSEAACQRIGEVDTPGVYFYFSRLVRAHLEFCKAPGRTQWFLLF